ncbi:MAG: hypothetical protein HQK96_13535 [Nitrospirae bacterium]|nr:hypothetical protein [Nitrospirota bacterium]
MAKKNDDATSNSTVRPPDAEYTRYVSEPDAEILNDPEQDVGSLAYTDAIGRTIRAPGTFLQMIKQQRGKQMVGADTGVISETNIHPKDRELLNKLATEALPLQTFFALKVITAPSSLVEHAINWTRTMTQIFSETCTGKTVNLQRTQLALQQLYNNISFDLQNTTSEETLHNNVKNLIEKGQIGGVLKVSGLLDTKNPKNSAVDIDKYVDNFIDAVKRHLGSHKVSSQQLNPRFVVDTRFKNQTSMGEPIGKGEYKPLKQHVSIFSTADDPWKFYFDIETERSKAMYWAIYSGFEPGNPVGDETITGRTDALSLSNMASYLANESLLIRLGISFHVGSLLRNEAILSALNKYDVPIASGRLATALLFSAYKANPLSAGTGVSKEDQERDSRLLHGAIYSTADERGRKSMMDSAEKATEGFHSAISPILKKIGGEAGTFPAFEKWYTNPEVQDALSGEYHQSVGETSTSNLHKAIDAYYTESTGKDLSNKERDDLGKVLEGSMNEFQNGVFTPARINTSLDYEKNVATIMKESKMFVNTLLKMQAGEQVETPSDETDKPANQKVISGSISTLVKSVGTIVNKVKGLLNNPNDDNMVQKIIARALPDNPLKQGVIEELSETMPESYWVNAINNAQICTSKQVKDSETANIRELSAKTDMVVVGKEGNRVVGVNPISDVMILQYERMKDSLRNVANGEDGLEHLNNLLSRAVLNAHGGSLEGYAVMDVLGLMEKAPLLNYS